MSKPLFLVGAHKTGTSTMVNMINSCVDIFIAYELFLNKRKREAFVNTFPLSNTVYNGESLISTVDNLATFANKYKEYTYVGDKLPGIHFEILRQIQSHKHIFTIRDVRTWPAKNSITSMRGYETGIDAVPAIVDYVRFFIESFRSENCLHISMEDIILNNSTVIDRLSMFLGVQFSYRWWRCTGKWKDDLKNAHQWWGGHPSAAIIPKHVDTITLLKSHIFWDNLLPIFDKYYSSTGGIFYEQEIKNDLIEVEKLRNIGKITLDKLFEDIKNIKIT